MYPAAAAAASAAAAPVAPVARKNIMFRQYLLETDLDKRRQRHGSDGYEPKLNMENVVHK
jgi:hypothetical protein